jgi:hypothetical protein
MEFTLVERGDFDAPGPTSDFSVSQRADGIYLTQTTDAGGRERTVSAIPQPPLSVRNHEPPPGRRVSDHPDRRAPLRSGPGEPRALSRALLCLEVPAESLTMRWMVSEDRSDEEFELALEALLDRLAQDLNH